MQDNGDRTNATRGGVLGYLKDRGARYDRESSSHKTRESGPVDRHEMKGVP